jgi:hypothetical protein
LLTSSILPETSLFCKWCAVKRQGLFALEKARETPHLKFEKVVGSLVVQVGIEAGGGHFNRSMGGEARANG